MFLKPWISPKPQETAPVIPMKTSSTLNVAATLRGVCLGALSLALPALVSTSLHAAEPAQILVATQDTFIHGGNKETNYGNATSLQLAGRNVDNARKIYLGFDLSGVDASKGFSEASTLSLSFANSTLIGQGSSLLLTPLSFSVYGITDNTAQFNESVITWSGENTTAPKNNTSNSTGFHVTNVALLGSVTIDPTSVAQNGSVVLSGLGLANYLNWAVGNSGDAYGTGRTQANGKKITLMLAIDAPYAGTSYPGFYFHSSEAAVNDTLKPHLVLELNQIPEPSSFAAVFGACALTAVVVRRKARR